jgi:hypothetical protein
VVRGAVRGVVGVILAVWLVATVVSPAVSGCGVCVHPSGHCDEPMAAPVGHHESHSCCRGMKIDPCNKNEGCAYETPGYVGPSAPRLQLSSKPAPAIAFMETEAPQEPRPDLYLEGLTFRRTSSDPLYLRNLSFLC